jgi:superfamily II DNA or RNA helicase
LLDRVTDGDLIGLSCADLLTAGVDRPAIKCVIQARPTLSLVVHLQQTGRCMRPWDGVAPVILDHAGNSRRLGLPQEERDWQAIFESETGASSVQSSGSRQRAKVCERCFGVMPPHVAACRLCDTVFPPSAVPPLAPEKDGALSRVAVDQATKDEAWETILKVASSVGADEAWAAKVYETRFGGARRAA